MFTIIFLKSSKPKSRSGSILFSVDIKSPQCSIQKKLAKPKKKCLINKGVDTASLISLYTLRHQGGNWVFNFNVASQNVSAVFNNRHKYKMNLSVFKNISQHSKRVTKPKFEIQSHLGLQKNWDHLCYI